ncbi:TRAP transporter small permease subunit [Falsiroseomonas selenitidurans]|uniref:TRAP transporter small permease protein n=1 Tax=Falsiroseomonas selenitidurans TaxID=2716335 RepID=A0ABX1DXV1_9PROT|nr:TRAP transporter small permease [Falsiroseomonas selenitidurans]NKC29735.1 TRAP transporter small permease [Falsiroseomonas selenitidurans]
MPPSPSPASLGANPVAARLLPATRFFSLLCGWWLLGYSALVCADLVARRYFGVSLQGTDEIGGYTLAGLVAFGFAHTLLVRRHTRIDLFLSHLGALPRAVAHVVAAVAIAAFAVFAASRGWAEMAESIEFMSVSTSPLQVPLWIPQGVWFAGLAVFGVVATLLALHALFLLARFRLRQINAWYGPPTVDEEIAAETGRGAAR